VTDVSNLGVPLVVGCINGKVVKVKCPYCSQLHQHGYSKEAYPAHRVAHCHLDKSAAGYVVIVTRYRHIEDRQTTGKGGAK